MQLLSVERGSRRVWLAAFVAACEADPTGVDVASMPDSAAPPPPMWSDRMSAWSGVSWADPGGQMELMISDGVPNAQVAVIASDGGFGRGPCLPWLGGPCLGVVRGPTWSVVPIRLDRNGSAIAQIGVPPGVVGPHFAIQVVDPVASIASGAVEYNIVPPGCTLTQAWPDCGPLPPTPYATGPFFASFEVGYDPDADAAVSWRLAGARAMKPASIELIVQPDAGILTAALMPCFVTIEATGPVPRAAWSTTAGRRRFGFDLTVGVNATATTDCRASDIGAADIAAFLTDVVECQSFSVEIEEGTGRAATEYLYGKIFPFQEFTGMTIRYADRCGDPVQSHPMVGCAREARADMSLPPGAPILSGQRRFTVNAAGDPVPARAMWYGYVIDWNP